MDILIGIICISTFLVALFIFNKCIRDNYVPNKYERELLDYFKEVALKSEFDDNPQRVIKWKNHMTLYVFNYEEYPKQMEIVKKTINQINKLATDGFSITLNKEIYHANAIFYMCKKDEVSRHNPDFYKMFNDGIIDDDFSGLAYIEFNWKDYTINKALIYVDIDDHIDIQESAIVEELTQSIGLPNDTNKYPNSIFYNDKSEKGIITKEYSKMDTDIIRLLYHPKMKPGLNSKQAENVIKKILKSEKDN